MKKPDLLILIAVWEFFVAFMTLIGIGAIVVFAFPAVLGDWYYWNGGMMMDGRVGGVFGLGVAIVFLFCWLIVSIAGGIGLISGKEWGRITSIVHSALSLFSVPVGTVIGILAIIYLTKPEVKEYFTPPPQP